MAAAIVVFTLLAHLKVGLNTGLVASGTSHVVPTIVVFFRKLFFRYIYIFIVPIGVSSQFFFLNPVLGVVSRGSWRGEGASRKLLGRPFRGMCEEAEGGRGGGGGAGDEA